jgi:ATP-dependent Lhr-like helicase
VSRTKIARRLSEHVPAGHRLNVCLQVNVDRDPNKAGVDPGDVAALLAEVRTAGPFRDLSAADFDLTLDLTATGGYALQAYDRFRRLVRNPEGLWTVRNGETARRHRLNLGAILSPEMLSVRIAQGARLVGGRKIGEIEDGYFEMLDPGDTFVFAGQVWSLAGITGMDVLVRPARDSDPKMPSWGGSKFALSSHLARRVRRGQKTAPAASVPHKNRPVSAANPPRPDRHA